MLSMFKSEGDDDQGSQLNPWLIVGFLNEALVKISRSNDLDVLWTHVCESVKWILPISHIGVAIQDKDYTYVKVYERGKEFQLTTPTQQLLENGFLKRTLSSRFTGWQSTQTYKDLPENEFDDWLKRSDMKHCLLINITSQDTKIGTLIIGFDKVTVNQKSNFFSIATMYSHHIGMNYFMIKTKDQLRKSYDALDEVHEALNDKNKNIMDSINYAQTIQQAILTTHEEIKKVANDYFIIYRPKDIVSGDFYWFSKVNESESFAIVIDCTGHGVPGAFMSLIGYTLLNEIVNQKNIHDPSLILQILNLRLSESLNRGKKDFGDGMDICLCKIVKLSDDRVKIVFAGAKRPLYYIEKEADQLTEIKGDRVSIGGYKSHHHTFTNHEIYLPVGTNLYLSTDGFADQNNELRKRIGSARLKKFLVECSPCSMSIQKEGLEKILDEHQGELPQRDDITLLGIKL